MIKATNETTRKNILLLYEFIIIFFVKAISI